MGSTLLMQFLASSPDVVLDRRYPHGEYRYLSYCSRAASYLSEPWRPDVNPGVTELFFGEEGRFGPLPFEPESLDLGDDRLGDWLDLTLDPGVAARSRSEIPHHITTDSVDASIGRWERELAPVEAETTWESLGSRLEPFGYTESII